MRPVFAAFCIAASALVATVPAAGPALAQGKAVPGPQAQPDDKKDAIRVELNALETLQDRCRMSFVIENRAAEALESVKLDLAVFNAEGIVQRRLIIDLGPIRAAKTIVRAFELDSSCAQLGAILVNDVTACAPLSPEVCLDRLLLASRPANVRFYK